MPRLLCAAPRTEALDRLAWAASATYVSFGVRFGIRVNEPGALARLTPLLPPGTEPAASQEADLWYSLSVGPCSARAGLRHFHLVCRDDALVSRTLDLEEALEAMESDIHLQVAAAAPSRLFVHAGVVGWGGRAIVIPGRSFSGKSTLVASLVRAGATYYSDEYAVFDAGGRVYPYPKPLSLREKGVRLRVRRSVAALGGSVGDEPAPVGLIAFSEYRSGARWRPRALSPGQAVLGLLANTVPARARPALALTTLGHVVSQASAVKGARGEAEALVPALLTPLAR